jgi:hypothetical protein
MDPNFQQAVTEVSENYFKNKFKKIERIYIELEAIQDFRLGAVICLSKNEVGYDYVRRCIVDYNKRTDDLTAKYFPALRLSEEMIDVFISNPKNHKALVLVSPMNNLFSKIPDMIRAIFEDNRRASVNNPGFEIMFGTSSVIYSQEHKKVIENQIKSFNNLVNVTILNRPLHEIEEDTVIECSTYIVDSVARFLNNPTITKWLENDRFFASKMVLGYPVVHGDPDPGETKEQQLEKLRRVLSVYFDYNYLERGVYF